MAAVLTDRFDPGRLRVRDIVALGRHPHSSLTGWLSNADQVVINDALAAVGAGHLVNAELGVLSDGQRQRVMVARALAQEPRVLLLDEPTAFLDPPGRVSLLELLRDVCTERDIAVLICTHDIEGILQHADAIWVTGADRRLTVGGPEDLAWNGLLAAPFATPGVRFNLATLSFESDRTGGPPAEVTGDGQAAALAGRCLQRAGFDLGGDASTHGDAALVVSPTAEGWRLHHPRLGTISVADYAELNTQARRLRAAMQGVDDG